MSVVTTADEHIKRASEFIERARTEVGSVLLDKEMWGRDEFKDGFIRNVFDRLDALAQAIEGKDPEGNERAARIPPYD